jgi:ribonucleoside-diphosphate reductase alpha chain
MNMVLKIKKITQIKKRTGEVVDFNKLKIKSAILKAMKSVDQVNESLLETLVEKVILVLESKFVNKIPSVEDVSDTIEYVLIATEQTESAKSFILYREEKRKLRENKEIIEDKEIVKKLKESKVSLSKQAINVLNNSDAFKDLGLIIFLDRYSLKSKRDQIEVGDLVITITKEDPKYPKKDIGIVKDIVNNKLHLHMITGVYADQYYNYEFIQDQSKSEKPSESVFDTYKRVAKAVARVEKDEYLKNKWFEEFYEQLKNNHISPGGRILSGASVDDLGYTSNLTLYNCYVIPSAKDSRSSIIKDAAHQMTEIFSRGGGVGTSLSSLRPAYAYVRGVHGRSSGAVSWGGLFSFITGLIEQGGSRRGALMLMLDDWHPDIYSFIDSKTKSGVLEHANISVKVSDSLMEAVKNDDDWYLEFPDYENATYSEVYDQEWDGDLKGWKEKGYPTKIYEKVKARELWKKIIQSAWKSAEPGVVFMERYNKLSNSYYFNKIVATNPCGEQGLPPWGVCNLGHLYLASFAEKVGEDEIGPLYEFNWDKLKKSARVLTRFLDNIIDLTPYFFSENEKVQKSERRIGGGTLGLAELLIRLRIKYGSKESINFIDKLYKTITCEMYSTSALLAEEKGFFPKFDKEKYLNSNFIKELPLEIQEKIKEKGIRNVTLITQAPTGSTGTMIGTSTGIEPYFAFKFYRQSRLGFHEVNVPLAQDYIKDGKLPDFFISAMELSPDDHITVQAAIQKWTDSSISKTANVPANFTVEQTEELYIKAYELGCKGVTIYRDSSRDEQALSTDKNLEQKNAKSIKKQLDEKTKKVKVQEPVVEEEKEDVVYGSEAGETCPSCKKGTMIKLGGCTECSAGCGFKGSCDMKN